MRTIDAALGGIQRVAEILIGLMLAVMILVVFAQTFFRYVIFASLPWSEELSRFLFVALIALGINIGISRNMMVRIDVLDARLGPSAKRYVEMGRQVVGIVMNAFFAYSTIELVQIGLRQQSPALGIPMAIMYVTLMIGFVLAALASVLRIYNLAVKTAEERE